MTARGVTGKAVCGYLSADVPDEVELAALRSEIAHFCKRSGHHLITIFTDREVKADQVKRPGLGGLLDVLALPTVEGVVVPTLSHLSSKNAALALLRRLIRRTGSQVIVIHPQEDKTKADGA
ncbi:recombinase family protein [Actinosynnema sp. CA-248983]